MYTLEERATDLAFVTEPIRRAMGDPQLTAKSKAAFRYALNNCTKYYNDPATQRAEHFKARKPRT